MTRAPTPTEHREAHDQHMADLAELKQVIRSL
jgi:hypothetical protein